MSAILCNFIHKLAGLCQKNKSKSVKKSKKKQSEKVIQDNQPQENLPKTPNNNDMLICISNSPSNSDIPHTNSSSINSNNSNNNENDNDNEPDANASLAIRIAYYRKKIKENECNGECAFVAKA